MVHDPEELSLALAIDMLWPCHWRFEDNLQIVLDAIGGRAPPEVAVHRVRTQHRDDAAAYARGAGVREIARGRGAKRVYQST